MFHTTTLLGIVCVSIGLLGCQKPEAVALIRVSSVEDDGQLASARAFERYRKVQTQLITSPFVIVAALRTLQPHDLEILRGHKKPLDWLKNEIKVQPISEIIRISMKGEREDEIVQVLQAVVVAYLEEIANTEREERSREIQVLREQELLLMNEIKEKAERINTLSEELGVVSVGKTAIARQRLEHQVDGAHERIKHLSIRLDDLVVQTKSTEANGDKNKLQQLVAQINAVEQLLTNANADYQQHLDQLIDTFAFSTDLDMRVFEVEQLKRQLGDVMSEVGTLERRLSRPPRVTMVQPAIIVEDADSHDEGESDDDKANYRVAPS